MSIINNAVDSIILGLEDYETGEQNRLISCTRNIFAGILLLFKHKLASISPANSDEVLIKQKVMPEVDTNGNICWVGKGKKTVDVQEIKDRFTSLGIKTHWDRVEKINKYRNDIEHYHTNLSKDAIRELISDCFIVVRDFISEELQQDPKALLGEESWATLISVAEVYAKEKQECVSSIDEVDWGSDAVYSAIIEYNCMECGSNLIPIDVLCANKEDIVFMCKSCETTYNYEQMITLSLEEYFSGIDHMSIKDGGSPSLLLCPNCCNETYIFEEKRCALCEESVEHECLLCSNDIPAEELDGSGYCGWCAHRLSKDD